MSRALHSDYNLPLYLLTRLSFKAVRGSFLFSFVIIFVLIPILNYGNYKLLGLTPELQITVVHTARRLMPIAVCFLPLCCFVYLCRRIAKSFCVSRCARDDYGLLFWLVPCASGLGALFLSHTAVCSTVCLPSFAKSLQYV